MALEQNKDQTEAKEQSTSGQVIDAGARKTKTFRMCEIVTKIDHLPGYPDHWEEKINESLENQAIKFYAWILHNRDLKEDGSSVEPHVHIFLKLNNSYQATTIAGIFGLPHQTVEKIKSGHYCRNKWMADFGGALAYLTHLNSPEKYQYDDADVHSNYDWISERNKSLATNEKRNATEEILDKIALGEIRECEITQYFTPKEYFKYNDRIKKALEYYHLISLQNINRNVIIFYIYGPSGVGKTTLAKEIGQSFGTVCISASSRDPLQDYHGEQALILDELRPDTWNYADLLKLLDNHTSSSVNSRYQDKHIDVDAIIITTVLCKSRIRSTICTEF